MMCTMDDLIILEDFIPKQLQDMLDNLLHSSGYKWVYSDNTSGNEKIFDKYVKEKSGVYNKVKDHGQFSSLTFHHLASENEMDVKFLETFTSLIWFMFDRVPDATISQYERVKSNLILQKSDDWANKIAEPHVDAQEKNRKSLLYYVNDSDGDTIIYNERYDDAINGVPLTERKRVSPRKGDAILFDSDIIHSHEYPIISKKRTIINFCFHTQPNETEEDLQEIEV